MRALAQLARGTIRVVEAIYVLIRCTTMLAFLLLLGYGAYSLLHRPDLPGRMVLHLSLPATLSEATGWSGQLQALLGGGPTLWDVAEALRRAAADPHVTAVVADIGTGPFTLAQTQELSQALAVVRAAGKPSYAFADSFGELLDGTGAYHLASAFDRIWLQPSGIVGLTGIGTVEPMYGDLLRRFGITAEFSARERYKTVANPWMHGQATPAQTEMMQDLVHDLTDQVTEQVAERRHLAPQTVHQLLDQAPFTDREAQQQGLVDRLGYRDELVAELAGMGEIVPVQGYVAGTGRAPAADATQVALIVVEGQLARGDGQDGVLGGGLAADTIAGQIQAAADQPAIKAIVLRVNSPGGNPSAAETIRRAVVAARAKGKPVVVSMGAVAGSGGYWLAVDADAIVAEPATLTGSIGVVGGKLSFAGLARQLGVGLALTGGSEHATMASPLTSFSDGEAARRDALLDATYQDFLARVAAGRKLEPAVVREVAQGRVWTGRQALERGLVDRVGGLWTALAAVQDCLDLPATAALQLVHPTTVSGGAGLLQHVLGVSVQAVLPSLLASVSAALRPELLTLLHGIELRG